MKTYVGVEIYFIYIYREHTN